MQEGHKRSSNKSRYTAHITQQEQQSLHGNGLAAKTQSSKT